MKKTLLTFIAALTVSGAFAEYTFKIPLESDNGGILPQGAITFSEWVTIIPLYTIWVNEGETFNCTNWSPSPSTVTTGQSFTQTATDCEQNQTRTRQDREQETTTLAIRNVGTPVIENRTLTNQSNTRTATGTKETWVATTPTYAAWVNSGGIYGCSNWSPAPSTVTTGQLFTQTATDCEQDETRTRQDREQETTTLAIRNAGTPVTENRTLTNQSNTRTATGTKQEKFCNYQPDQNNLNTLTYLHKNTVFTGQYKTVPKIWAYISTAKDYITFNPIPGLSPVSSTELRYNDGSKIWRITRGALRYTDSKGQYYEVCLE